MAMSAKDRFTRVRSDAARAPQTLSMPRLATTAWAAYGWLKATLTSTRKACSTTAAS
jgi:hypothetical protein